MRRKPFSEEEKEKAFSLKKKYGNDYSRIAQELPGRSAREIKFMFEKNWNKSLPIFQNWTCEEDQLLLSLVKKHGRHWVLFEGYFENRSKGSLKLRYIYLLNKKRVSYADERKEKGTEDVIPFR